MDSSYVAKSAVKLFPYNVINNANNGNDNIRKSTFSNKEWKIIQKLETLCITRIFGPITLPHVL